MRCIDGANCRVGGLKAALGTLLLSKLIGVQPLVTVGCPIVQMAVVPLRKLGEDVHAGCCCMEKVLHG